MNRADSRLFALLSVAVLFHFAIVSAVASLPQATRHPKQAESWRKQPPKPGASRPFTLPASRETRSALPCVGRTVFNSASTFRLGFGVPNFARSTAGNNRDLIREHVHQTLLSWQIGTGLSVFI